MLYEVITTSAGLALSGSLDHISLRGLPDPSLPLLVGVGYFAFITAYLMVILFWQVRVTNLTWSTTRLGPHRLQCTLRTRDMLWIYLTSALAILFSLGLLIPWASVRLARYRIGRTALLAHGSLDTFAGAVGAEVSALGEEVGDIFDIDIEIGF